MRAWRAHLVQQDVELVVQTVHGIPLHVVERDERLPTPHTPVVLVCILFVLSLRLCVVPPGALGALAFQLRHAAVCAVIHL